MARSVRSSSALEVKALETISEEFSIGELSKRTGLAPSALRYYETIGLVAPLRRVGGKRLYGPEAERAVKAVRLAQAAGFTLQEARELQAGLESGEPFSARWRALATRKIEELDRIVAEVTEAKARLTAAMVCDCQTTADCPHINAGEGLR